MSRTEKLDENPLANTPYQIVDDGSLHKYRTEIPNSIIRGIRGRELSLPARWLYIYLKSVAGDTGACWQSTTTISKGSRLGRSTVSTAKDELIKHGLIRVEPRDKNKSDSITLVDIWEQNFAEFAISQKPASSVEKSSSASQRGEEPNGVTDVQHLGENTNVSLTNLVDALQNVASRKANSANPAEIEELRSIILSLFAKVEDLESTTSDFSAKTATKNTTSNTVSRCSPQEHLENQLNLNESLTIQDRCSPQEHLSDLSVHDMNTKVFTTGTQVFTTGTQEDPFLRRSQKAKKEDNTATQYFGAPENSSAPIPSSVPPEKPVKPPRKPKTQEWPEAGFWLRDYLADQDDLTEVDAPKDPDWWVSVVGACSGINEEFLRAELCKINAWLIENPAKRPTSGKGTKRFIRSWLTKAKDDYRRYAHVK